MAGTKLSDTIKDLWYNETVLCLDDNESTPSSKSDLTFLSILGENELR